MLRLCSISAAVLVLAFPLTNATAQAVSQVPSTASRQSPAARLQSQAAAQLAARAKSPVKPEDGRGKASPQNLTLPVTLTPLYNFQPLLPDGYNPAGQLIQASDGNLYGTTLYGTANGCGEVYQVTPAGAYSTFYSLTCGVNGSFPYSGLIEASNGNLYGTTSTGGGSSSGGTIFEINPQTQAFTLAYTFTDGGSPAGDMIDDGQGNLYGTSTLGGVNGMGSVWSFNYNTSTFTTLYSFTGAADGGYPSAGLVLASDGNLYGLTAEGGDATAPSGDGTAFVLPTSGATFNTIYTFAGTDGSGPSTDLVEGPDGNLYGTAYSGGAYGFGSFFSITPSGASSTLSVLASFLPPEGTRPQTGRPFVGGDGNLYLAGSDSGANGYGALMQATTAGAIADVYDFDTATDDQAQLPYAQPFEATDGNLYGTTYSGGTYTGGILYQAQTGGAAGLPPVITLSPSATTIAQGSTVTLTWAVTNAFSLNAQVCIAYSSDGSWTGALTGTSGSAIVTPTATGTVNYSFTCGGVESATTAVTVNVPVASTTTLTVTPNPATVGQTLTFTATVTGSAGTPTGTVTFSAFGTTFGPATLNGSGVATITAPTSSVTAGSYPITATYSGDTSYSGSTSNTITLQLNNPTVASTTTLTVAPNPATVGQSLTLTATVTGTAGTPTGTVTFSAFGTTLGPVTLNSSGIATISAPTTGITAGSYPITATYSGNTSYNGSTSNTVNLQLNNPPVASTTTLAVAPNPATVGQSVSLTATVTGTAGTPTGTVTFSAYGVTLGSAGLNGSGVANLTAPTTGIAPGNYPVIATYSGDTNYNASTSNTVTVQLKPAIVSTTTTLSASPNPVSVGQSITLMATVVAASGTPTGTVTFSADGVTLGSSTLSSGVATFTASAVGFPPGNYPVIARYSGNASYGGSSSAPVNVVLSKAATTTMLTANPTTVTPPADVTLTATVTRSASGSTGVPTGTVTFSVGSTVLATVKVNGSGVAALTAPSTGYPAGSYPVKATYNGDGNDNTSVSSAVTVKVE